MRPIRRISIVLAFGLLAMAVLGLALVGDRVFTALFNLWKFSGYMDGHGIDLGANSSFQFLSLCLLATSACMLLALRARDWGDKLLYQLATAAGAIYFINGLLLFSLVSFGLAFLYCGR